MCDHVTDLEVILKGELETNKLLDMFNREPRWTEKKMSKRHLAVNNIIHQA